MRGGESCLLSTLSTFIARKRVLLSKSFGLLFKYYSKRRLSLSLFCFQIFRALKFSQFQLLEQKKTITTIPGLPCFLFLKVTEQKDKTVPDTGCSYLINGQRKLNDTHGLGSDRLIREKNTSKMLKNTNYCDAFAHFSRLGSHVTIMVNMHRPYPPI